MRFEYPIGNNAHFLKGASNSMGFYPLGIYNNWHGGIHIERANSDIRAIADGHIIAYRLPLKSIKTEKENKKYSYSNGFIIVRHKYTSPKGQSLHFYSLYNHLLPKEEYNDTVNKIPSCYLSSEKQVKAGKKTKKGIKIWKNNSKTTAEFCFLPYGTVITLGKQEAGTEGKFQQNEDYKWVEAKDLKGNVTAEGYINMKNECVTDMGSGKYRVKYTRASSEDENLEVWKSDKFEELLCLLAPGSKIKITKYDKKLAVISIEGQTGYIKNPDLYLHHTWNSQIKTDEICKCTIPVKAGETIGYAGSYGGEETQNNRTAHIEVFTDDKENLEKFLNNKCQEGKKAFIKLPDQVGALKYKFLSGTEVKIQNDNGSKSAYVKVSIGKVRAKVDRKNDLDDYDSKTKKYTFDEKFDNLNTKLKGLLSRKGFIQYEDKPLEKLVGNEREIGYYCPIYNNLFWIKRSDLTVIDKDTSIIGDRKISNPEIKEVDLYFEKPAESEDGKNEQPVPKEQIIETGKLKEIIQSDSPDVRWYYISSQIEDIEGQKCTKKGYFKKDPKTEFSAFEWGKFGFRIFGEQEDKDRYLYDLTPQPEDSLIGYVQSLVDRGNKNGVLEPQEFDDVMKDPARVNQLSHMVCYHHNEWGYDNNLPKLMKEFEKRYDSLINNEKEQKYKDQLRQQKEQQLAELEQKIKDLCFWKSIAGKYELHLTREKTFSINPDYSEQLKATAYPKFGMKISDNNGHPEMTVTEKYTETFKFPSNPHVYHLHPIAFIEQMKRMNIHYSKGDSGKVIREINFRLAGFGGVLPGDTFTENTEKGVKQFQRDYMNKPNPTGIVDDETLAKIDEFSDKYRENVEDYKCQCGKCTGFGSGQFKGEYLLKEDIDPKTQRAKRDENGDIIYKKDENGNYIPKSKTEKHHKYEYPGIHQSLLWAVSASRFYLTIKLQEKYTINCVFSAYRCWEDNKNHNRTTTNHMGKAVDLHFNKNKILTTCSEDMDELREKIYCECIGAPKNEKNKECTFGWTKNKFGLESKKEGAKSWVHIDVREFTTSTYLEDEYFIKSNEEQSFKLELHNINN